MKTRMLLCVLTVAAALAGCTAQAPVAPGTPTAGAGAATSAAGPSGSATTTPGGTAAGDGVAEEAVRQALLTYQGAVASGDFVGACGLLTVESATALVTAVQSGGGVVANCPEALRAVVGQPGAADAAIEAAMSIVVDDVTIDGLNATITWTSERQGSPRTDTLTLQNVGGQWRLAGSA